MSLTLSKSVASVYQTLYLGLCITILCFTAINTAQASFAANKLLPKDPLVKVGELKNGLRYYIRPNSQPQNKVELRLVVKAGSLQEDEDQLGLAHFVEHMAFNGTRRFPKNTLISYLESMGIQFGSDLNAYTTFDKTVYILPIPSKDKDNLVKGFQVLEDWAHGVLMQDEEIENERAIILEEKRLHKGKDDRIEEKMRPFLYGDSLYGKRAPIGEERIIKNFKPEALKRFYRDWYRPNLMAVIVVGDIQTKEAEKLIHQHFAHLTNPEQPRPLQEIKLANNSSTNAHIISDEEEASKYVRIHSNIRTYNPYTHIKHDKSNLIHEIAEQLIHQRLTELGQKKKSTLLNASIESVALSSRHYLDNANIQIDRLNPKQGMQELLTEFNLIKTWGFSQSEITRAKREILNNYAQNAKEDKKIDSTHWIDNYIEHFMTNLAYLNLRQTNELAQHFIPKISKDEVNLAARNYLTQHFSQPTIIYSVSTQEEKKAPKSDELITYFEQAMAAPIIQKKNEEKSNAPSSLLTTPPKPGRILHEHYDPRLAVHTLQLSNGIEVKLKPTKFTNDSLSIRMERWGGLAITNPEDARTMLFAPHFISEMGYGSHTPSDLKELKSGHQLQFSQSLSYYQNSFDLTTNFKDLEFALQYMYLTLTSPRSDIGLFSKNQKQWVEFIKQNELNPETKFNKEIAQLRFQNHPLAMPLPSENDIKKFNMYAMVKLYQEQFSDFNQTKISIVGSFDPTKIKPLLERYFASLPSVYPHKSNQRNELKDLGLNSIQGVVRHTVYAGSEDKAQVRIYFNGVENGNREEETTFYALIDILNIHITEELREKKKLIYTGVAYGDITRVPSSRFDVSLTLPCAPENVDAVSHAVFEEINKLKEQGPSLSDLQKIQKNWLLEIESKRKTNAYWLDKLQETQMYKYDPYLIFGSEKRIKNLTIDSIQEAAKRYFSETNYVHAVLLPEKKQTEEQKR